MNLLVALNIIQNNIQQNIIESRHFKEKCNERNFDINSIKKLIQKNKILGILEQNNNLYKIWYFYEKNKDLNIILKIINNRIKLITIFPSESKRRQK